jgi:5'-3' exonuclease
VTPSATTERSATERSVVDRPAAERSALEEAAAEPGTRSADRAPRLLAVDGNSLGHRGFHSSKEEAANGPAGDGVRDERPLVTGAVVSMLASAWVHGPYDGIVVGFDHAVNRRKVDHPEYKANRPPTPPELTSSLEVLRDHLRACGFLVVEHHGAEADDVIAATVDACADRGWWCDVLSSDRDLTALVDATTRLLRPRATFSDLLVETEVSVRRTYGIAPWQYTDLAALRGDPSDGLTGATGIGPKIAARLLRDHDTVSGLYEVLYDLPPKVEASLREARARIERNLELMAPIPHLEVPVDEAIAAGVDPERVLAALEPLGVAAAARRLERAITSPMPPPPPPPDDPLSGPDPAASVSVPTAVRRGGPDVGEQGQLF